MQDGATESDPAQPASVVDDDRDPRNMPTWGGDVVIAATGVRRIHGQDAGVQDADLEVPRGTIVGLVGPSGSGKTTMVRLILGVYPPDAGELSVFGKRPMAFDADDRRRIGYLPQSSLLYPDLSLRHNLNFVASLYGLPWRSRWWPKGKAGKRARARIDEALGLVDLQDRQGVRLGNSSGGERRRLALAAAMVHEPELLVLDEPTAGVDPVLRRRLWDQFKALRDDGRTVFVTTQYVNEAAHCDLVAVLMDGRILLVDTPEGLRRTAYSGELVDIELDRAVPDGELEGVSHVDGVRRLHERVGWRKLRYVVRSAEDTIPDLVAWFQDRGVTVETAAPFEASFDDVFVALVEDHRERKREEEQTSVSEEERSSHA